MSELSDESKALIDREGPLDEATPAEIEAMHARVVALLAGVPAPVPSPEPSSLVGKAATTTTLKVVSATIAAAVASSALIFALSRPTAQAPMGSASPPPVSAAPRPPLASPAASSVDVSSEPAPAVSGAAPPRSLQPRAPAPATPRPGASEEALLVAAAEAQLRAGHPAAALALYEQHLREFPKGALRRESHSGRVVALCGVGRSAEARADIARFAAANPGTPSLLRMQRACGVEP